MKNKDINILVVEDWSVGTEVKILRSQKSLFISGKNTSVL